MPMIPGLPPFQRRPNFSGGRRHVSPEAAERAAAGLAQMEAEDRWLSRWVPRICYLTVGLLIIVVVVAEHYHN